MFNAGVIASGKQSKYKLTSRQLVLNLEDYLYVVLFDRDGSLQISGASSYIILSDEWYKERIITIGEGHQVRATLQAGSGLSPNNSGTWRTINNQVIFQFNTAGGRILTEIRNSMSLAVVASAQFWTPGYAP